jgi:hypothetical protein
MMTFGVARSVWAMFNIPSHPLLSRLPQNSILLVRYCEGLRMPAP